MSELNGETVLSTTNEETLAETGSESVFASLGLNGQQFALQFFNFAIVFIIVWFLILKPLTKKMDERKRLIDESLEKAKEVENNFKLSEKKYQETIDDARVESNKIVAAAHDEANKLGARMKTEAKAEIDLLVTQAKKSIQLDREKMQLEFKVEVASVVVAAVEKVLEEKLDDKKDKELVEKTLKSLRG